MNELRTENVCVRFFQSEKRKKKSDDYEWGWFVIMMKKRERVRE